MATLFEPSSGAIHPNNMLIILYKFQLYFLQPQGFSARFTVLPAYELIIPDRSHNMMRALGLRATVSLTAALAT